MNADIDRQPKPPVAPPRQATAQALIEAAAAAFAEAGYEGVNSNEIARRAGFAPQTFYRHFKDKLEVFLAVYAQWVDREFTAVARIESSLDMARIVAAHHRDHLRFRRSLAALARSVPAVAEARARSREDQLKRLAIRRDAVRSLPRAVLISRLLTVERLADAIAEGEFERLGIGEKEALAQLAIALEALSAI